MSLPYDKFESGRPAVIVRPLGPMNKGMIATGNHIDLYSLRGAPPDSLHCRKIASGANRRLSFLSTGCHGAVEKTTGAEALQRLPPGKAFGTPAPVHKKPLPRFGAANPLFLLLFIFQMLFQDEIDVLGKRTVIIFCLLFDLF